MTLHRRTWLKLVAHSPWLALLFGAGAGAQHAADDPILSQDLKLLVDTLVPVDESPGAVSLGIHTAIEIGLRGNDRYRELLTEAVGWLNRESNSLYRARFSDLPEEARIRLLTIAEKSPRSSPQNQLFRLLRGDVMRRYYAHPDAWPQLDFQGPPQPLGFTDYNKQPARSDG